MPTNFAKALAARGVAPADIAAAESRQKNLGGGLETSLLELGLVSERDAIDMVTDLSRLPRPPRDLVEQLSPAAAPLFPQPLAERHGMVPLGLSRRQLQLMVRHPVDLAQVDEIGFLLSRPIKLYVGTELEIAEAMKEVYGVAVPPRFVELRKKIGNAPPPSGMSLAPAASSVSVPPVPVPASVPAPERSAPTRPPIPIEPVKVEAAVVDAVTPAPPPVPAPELPSRPEGVLQAGESVHEGEPAEPTTPAVRAEGTGADSGAGEGEVEGGGAGADSGAGGGAGAEVSSRVTPASEDPNSKEFWSDASDMLAMTPRAPALPEVSVPITVEEEPAAAEETSAFESAPIEVMAPVSADAAEPLTSGVAGRVAAERRISTSEAMAALREQKSRDGVIGTAVNYLRGAFDFVAIFVRKAEAFQVFEASGVDYGGAADLSQTLVDVDRSRVLQTIVQGRAPYVGPVPAGDPLEAALGAVGRARLRAVLLYPIVIRDRTVAIVHGDRGGEALAPRQLSDVALVLSQLGAQLERVIRERRKAPEAAVVPFPVPAPPVVASPVSAPKPQPPPRPPPKEPPSSDGDAVALEAASIAVDVEEEPFEVPIDWVDVDEASSFADQVRAFLSGDPPARAKAAEILRSGGAEAAWALAERFPGPLFVFRMAIDELPGPEGIGPVLGLMAAIGEDAVPALVQLADAGGEERRFWATVLLAKFGDKRAIDVLARRLLDDSPDTALAARRGLYRLRKVAEFGPVLDHLTTELTSTSNPERLTALIRALGQFHHVAAIPRLISFVGIRDPQISRAAADALRELTRQDFGTTERRWSSWWSTAKDKPRLQWLIEALESRERDLRLAAISELTEIAGLDFGYRSDIEPRKQETSLHRWREWWEREGRNRSDPSFAFQSSPG